MSKPTASLTPIHLNSGMCNKEIYVKGNELDPTGFCTEAARRRGYLAHFSSSLQPHPMQLNSSRSHIPCHEAPKEPLLSPAPTKKPRETTPVGDPTS